MIRGKRIAVTMPAYYAGKTVERMWQSIPHDVVDDVIFVDDCSKDDGFEKAKALGMSAHRNASNLNYGGNVKRCLQLALDAGADVVIVLHPDCQYSPAMAPAMAAMLIETPYDLCLASRTSGSGTMGSGMPFWKYLPNRIITGVMGLALGIRHTEFHTGYRAYTRRALENIPFHDLANNFIFDNEALVACLEKGYLTCEVTCPTIYEDDSSSIPFSKSVKYGMQCFRLSWQFLKKRLAGRIPRQAPAQKAP